MAKMVNMMAYLRNGYPYPKSLDRKGVRGNVTTESLVGYSKYTSKSSSIDRKKTGVDLVPGGYLKYTSDEEKTTKTFTNEGWKKSGKEMQEFRNYLASNWQEKGRLAWIPVQSYKDYLSASQHGLFDENDYAEITKNTLNKFFKFTGLNPDNMIWWMNFHNNKDHPHVHVAFIEKEETRTKATFSSEELKQFKRYTLTEMKQRERLILGTDKAFKNHMKEIQNDKSVVQDKGKKLIQDKQNLTINQMIQRLAKKLPTTGRLQYGSIHMKPYREEVNDIVIKILDHDLVKSEYEDLLEDLKELDQEYSQDLHESVTNMEDSEKEKIHKVIANAVLQECKNYDIEELQKEGVFNAPESYLQNKNIELQKSDVNNPFKVDSNLTNSVNYSDYERQLNNYEDNSNQYNPVGNSIDAALSAIRKSDSEVKREVQKGLDEYLETEEEREQKIYGKTL